MLHRQFGCGGVAHGRYRSCGISRAATFAFYVASQSPKSSLARGARGLYERGIARITAVRGPCSLLALWRRAQICPAWTKESAGRPCGALIIDAIPANRRGLHALGKCASARPRAQRAHAQRRFGRAARRRRKRARPPRSRERLKKRVFIELARGSAPGSLPTREGNHNPRVGSGPILPFRGCCRLLP